MSAILPSTDGDGFDGAFGAAREQLGQGEAAEGSGKGGGKRPPKRPPGADEFRDSGIVPVGTCDGRYAIIDSDGRLRSIPSHEMLRQHTLLNLWGSDEGWLLKAFGYQGRSGGDLIIPWERVGAALMKACHRLGIFDADQTPARHTGIWTEPGGRPLLHLGDVLWRAGAPTQRAGSIVTHVIDVAEDGSEILERHVYIREAARRRPAKHACSPAEIEDVREQLVALWRFREGPAAAKLLLGWAAMASLGGAARWRSNLLLLGGTGAGKSSLLEVLRGLLPIHAYTNDTTKAGLEGKVSFRPGPIIVDEAAQGDRSGAAALLDMMLPASGGDGSVGLRGAPNGQGRRFSVLGAVAYACIHPPPLKAEHQGRFTEINVLAAERDAPEEVERACADARGLGPALLCRVIEGHDRWQGNLKAMRAALVGRGAASREADQLGALLAGWWLLASDDIATDTDARLCVAEIADFVRGRAAQRDDGAGRRAWLELATTSVMRSAGTIRSPIGDLVRDVFATGGTATDEVARLAEAELRRIGIRAEYLYAEAARRLVRDAWSDDEAEPLGRYPLKVVWFGRNHRELRRLFDGTDYQGEAWWRAMEGLPAARRSLGNIRIGKAYSSGAFVVPLAVLDLPEDRDGPPAPPEDSG